MSAATTYLLVALGGAIGSMCRYAATIASARAWGPAFPWGTILINVVGSFIIAFFGTIAAPSGAAPTGPAARVFVMVGFCGGFTTFSSFSLQTLELAQAGRWFSVAVNVVVSVLACVAAAGAGHYVATLMGAPARVEP